MSYALRSALRSPSGWLAAAIGFAVLAPGDARADDGPAYALENMSAASPTITAVTVGSVLLADLAFTLVAIRDAVRGQNSEPALYGVQAGIGGLQAAGFLAAPFAFDVEKWGEGETLLMLLPAQTMGTMLTTHAIWSLTSDPIDPGSRLGASALIGANAAFTAIGLGGLVQEKWAPFEVSIAEIAHSCMSISVSSERLASDAEHRREWGLMLGWSILGLGHGIGSFLVEMPGSRVSEVEEKPVFGETDLVPFVQPLEGGLLVGFSGRDFP